MRGSFIPNAMAPAVALLVCFAAPHSVHAQADDSGASGSPNFTVRVRTTATAGEESTSPNFRLRSSMGPVTTGVSLMQSTSFSFEGESRTSRAPS